MTRTIVHTGVAVETDARVHDLAEELASTRAAFLRRAALFGGGAVAAASGLMALPGEARASRRSDVAILNFALTLEFLETQFYTLGVERVRFTNRRARRLAEVIRDHESAHVKALRDTIPTLGGRPVKGPKFDFGAAFESQESFMATAMALEDTGVSAYNGAGPALTLRPVKQAAASIVAVEAMHAASIRAMNGAVPAPLSFDEAKSKDEVLAIAMPFLAA